MTSMWRPVTREGGGGTKNEGKPWKVQWLTLKVCSSLINKCMGIFNEHVDMWCTLASSCFLVLTSCSFLFYFYLVVVMRTEITKKFGITTRN